jgi:hypothetical protein
MLKPPLLLPKETVEHIISYVNFVHPCASLIKKHYAVYFFNYSFSLISSHYIYLTKNIYWRLNKDKDIIGIYSSNPSADHEPIHIYGYKLEQEICELCTHLFFNPYRSYQRPPY